MLDYFYFPNSYGAGAVSGRWIIELLNIIMPSLGYTIKVPQFGVLFSIVIMSFANIFIFNMIDIKNKLLLFIAIIATMASPAVVNVNFFSFTSHLYAISILLIVLSVYRLMKYDNILLPSLFLVISFGIYQAHIPYLLSLYMVVFIIYIVHEEHKAVLYKISIAVLNVLLSFVIYFILFKIMNIIFSNGYVHIQHGSSNNLVPEYTFSSLLNSIGCCYVNIVNLITGNKIFAYNNTIYVKVLNAILLSLFIIVFVCFVYKFNKSEIAGKEKIKRSILLILAFILFPIAINFIFIMTNNNIELSESRVAYSYIFCIILFMYMLDFVVKDQLNVCKKAIKIFGIIICSLILFDQVCLAYRSYYVLQDNDLMLEKTANNIANEIIMNKEYRDDIKVLFVGNPEVINNYNEENIIPFWASSSKYNMISSCEIIGEIINKVTPMNFNLYDEEDEDYIRYSKYVRDMPFYPQDGYIVKKGDCLIVKLSTLYR